MSWKRLFPGDTARCTCGATFGHPEIGTVTWWIERQPGYRAPIPCVSHRCRNKRCKLVFWAVSVDAALADQPPELLPFARTG